MDILQAVIIFLSAALVITAAITVYLTYQYSKVGEVFDEYNEHIDELQTDLKTLMTDNLKLVSDNEKLIQSNDELIRMNKELLNTERVTVQAVPVSDMPDEEEKTEQRVSLDPSKERLPEGHTNVIYCEDYRRLNLPGSDQLKLQQDKNCMTEKDTGFRVWVDNENGERYYCAALAGAYGSDIGDTWRVTLRCGTQVNIIYSDYQHADQITNPDPDDFGSGAINADLLPATEVIEFVADLEAMPTWLYKQGTMTALDEFGGKRGDGGDIVKIEYLGRRWKP